MAICLRQGSLRLASACRLNVCQQSTTAIPSSQPSTDDGATPKVHKTIKDIPSPAGRLPFVGHLLSMIRSAPRGSLHEDFTKINRDVGAIAKLDIMGVTQVILADPCHLEDFFRSESKYPARPPINSWLDYRHDHGESMGLLTSEEEHWKKMRGVISKHMLRPTSTVAYFDPILNVTSDFLERLGKLVDEKGFVDRLPNELYKWSMEAIGTVLFQRRLGTLEEPIDPKSQQFIEAVNEMFYTTSALYGAYNLQKKYKSKWYRNHMKTWNFIFDYARYYIDEHLKRIENGDIKNLDGDFLAHLVLNPKLTKSEVVANATELLAAGVDTTSNSVCFNLYLLSQNLEQQDKLLQEIDEVVGDKLPTNENFQNMPYLRHVMKESFRLLPVAPLSGRITKDDIVIGGYLLPKGTMVTINHMAASNDPKYFGDPEKFIPERWEREGTQDRLHPFAMLAFGYGTRSCVGRRFAELEVRLCLLKILQKYRVEPDPSRKFTPHFRTVLSPGLDLPVRFVKR